MNGAYEIAEEHPGLIAQPSVQPAQTPAKPPAKRARSAAKPKAAPVPPPTPEEIKRAARLARQAEALRERRERVERAVAAVDEYLSAARAMLVLDAKDGETWYRYAVAKTDLAYRLPFADSEVTQYFAALPNSASE
ncbi:hypothetical protein SAMN05421812_101106 [Asanoa hainanensis]|uniref:Uncharacterized protein n=1 Tax=Asanoa hainanensis TaxID=560556 RepID=A0A239FWJ8_9ACTN|nr:hypothetical protein [Asanoa hainanensis]SNS61140.1 hypothetical protein SAMN05421812_101106 [Asanoa hainanensis]